MIICRGRVSDYRARLNNGQDLEKNILYKFKLDSY